MDSRFWWGIIIIIIITYIGLLLFLFTSFILESAVV